MNPTYTVLITSTALCPAQLHVSKQSSNAPLPQFKCSLTAGSHALLCWLPKTLLMVVCCVGAKLGRYPAVLAKNSLFCSTTALKPLKTWSSTGIVFVLVLVLGGFPFPNRAQLLPCAIGSSQQPTGTRVLRFPAHAPSQSAQVRRTKMSLTGTN